MNKNRLGEEHQVKISKNNSLTSRAGFCLPSASQRSPGKPGGLGELQRWKETSAKNLGAGEICLSSSVIHTETAPGERVAQFTPPGLAPALTAVISFHLGQGKAGGKPWQKTTGLEKNHRVWVKCSAKPAAPDMETESLDPGDEGFILGNLCNVVVKFLLDFSGHEEQRQPLLWWKPNGA